MCFMALNDEVQSQNPSNNDFNDDDELASAYDELLESFEKLTLRFSSLKKKNASLSHELEKFKLLEEKNEKLIKENSSLKENVHDMTKIVQEFILEKENCNMIKSEQRCSLEKQEKVSKCIKITNHIRNNFVKASKQCNIRCHYCSVLGHTSIDCNIRKSRSIDIRTRWMSKSLGTNVHGPNVV